MTAHAPHSARRTPSRSAAQPAAAPAPEGPAPQASRRSASSFLRRPETGALMGTVTVFIFFAIFGGAQFLTTGGVASWLNIAAELAIIALPVALLMVAGAFDLSVGSVVAGSSVTLAVVSGTYGMPIIVGILAALAVGAITGFVNGFIVVRTSVHSFIVTLATQFALAGLTLGLARVLTGSTSVSLSPDPFWKSAFGTLINGQFEVAIFWAIGIALVVAWVLQMTKFGNWIFATGGDNLSARAAGIPVAKVKISLFVASGLGAALVGIIQTMLYNGAQTGTGQSFVFNSIVAVVVGGVLLTGGYGSVIGVMLGCLTFAIVNQGIYYTGWNSDWAALILGILLLAAVLMNNTFRKLALSSGAPKTTTRKGH
ncbi:ABC transporter permease [Myceligenerans indicum]|uniref:Xylose transport system permease protein XylH n=1 Tax=Myceligenerans indicum TaxID=2593663 RepID=A0ABS1LG75_9MICO|nr:ABC transporter permease [Myceligenerans indicum]MBL0885231.1 ABC transporter permease [Myceligenerans indicum]